MIQLYAILDCHNKKMNNLQLPQKHREKEIAQLESFIKSDIDARELKRAIAVRMAISGNIYQEISKILGQYGSVKGYAVLKTINIGGFIMIPVPLCLTCLERNLETGFLTTLGLFLAHRS